MKTTKSEHADKFKPRETRPRRRFKPVPLRHKKKRGPKAAAVKGK